MLVACGFNCHAKCEMKVAPNCSYIKGKINRYQPPPPSRSSLSLRSSNTGRKNLSLTPSSSTTEQPHNSTPELLTAATHASTTLSSAKASAMETPAAATTTVAETSKIGTEETEPERPRKAIVLYSYTGQSEDEVSIIEGEELTVLGSDGKFVSG